MRKIQQRRNWAYFLPHARNALPKYWDQDLKLWGMSFLKRKITDPKYKNRTNRIREGDHAVPSRRVLRVSRARQKQKSIKAKKQIKKGQIPFIHSAWFTRSNNFYIFRTVFQWFPPCSTFNLPWQSLYLTIAHALLRKHSLRGSEPFESLVAFHALSAGA